MSLPWTGLTGSGCDDADACPAKMVLPRAEHASEEAAERGTVLHDYAHKVTLNPNLREEFLAEVPEEWRHTAKGMNLDAALEGIRVKACEVSYAIDVKERTCRFIGVNINRRYNEHLKACGEPELGHWEIPFTIDLEGESEVLGCPVELDYKSGQSIGAVEEHGQRRISAAGLMLYYGADTTVSRVAYIRDDGSIWPDGHEFTLIDAWETCDWAVDIIERVDAARAVLESGKVPAVYADRDEQCRYCRSMLSCPYWTNLARSTLEGLDLFKPNVEAMLPEELGPLFDRVKDTLKIFETLNDQLKEIARKQPLPVDDNYEFAEKSKKGRSFFDDSEARGLIATLLGRLGESDEDIQTRLAALNKRGKEVKEVRKVKRELPVLRKVG